MSSLLSRCSSTASECAEVINSRCIVHSAGLSGRVGAVGATSCRPIVKDTAAYDEGKIQSMVRQGDLPLSMVYLGHGGTEKLLTEVDQTVLFYWWEPSALVSDPAAGAPLIRMQFDPQDACAGRSLEEPAAELCFPPLDAARTAQPGSGTASGTASGGGAPSPPTTTPRRKAYPKYSVCDFEAARAHKGYSSRLVESNLGDVVAVVQGLQMPEADLAALLTAKGTREATKGVTRREAVQQIACEWLQEHPHVWTHWLRPQERNNHDGSSHFIGVHYGTWSAVFFVAVLLFVLMWLCSPLCLRPPPAPGSTAKVTRVRTPAEAWEGWANYPGRMHVLAGRMHTLIGRIRKGLRTFYPPIVHRVRRITRIATNVSMNTARVLPVPVPVLPVLGKSWSRFGIGSPAALLRLGSIRPAVAQRKRLTLPAPTPEQRRSCAQWSTSEAYGYEDSTLTLSIVRGASEAASPLRLCVWGEDLTSSNLCHNTLRTLGEQPVTLEAGQREATVEVKLVKGTTGSLNLVTGVWQSQRAFRLHLDLDLADEERVQMEAPVVPASRAGGAGAQGVASSEAGHESPSAAQAQRLGGATSCVITVYDMDDWPAPGAKTMTKPSVYIAFVLQVIRDNKWTEFWWLYGVLVKAFHSYIINPILFRYLLDVAVAQGDTTIALFLAAIKVTLLFLDDYTSFIYNSNIGVTIVSPVSWILRKWCSLPLDAQLDHTRAFEFQTLFKRVDREFGNKGYTTFSKGVTLVINVAFSLIATGIFARRALDVIVLYAANAFAVFVIFSIVHRSVPRIVAHVDRGFWRLDVQIDKFSALLYSEVIALRCAGRAFTMANRVQRIAADRLTYSFALFYLRATKTMLTSWIMWTIPIFLWAAAPILVEFKVLEVGELVGVLTSFASARTNLIALVAMREEWSISLDLVADLSHFLSERNPEADLKVAHSERQGLLIRALMQPGENTDPTVPGGGIGDKVGTDGTGDGGTGAALDLTSCLALHGVTAAEHAISQGQAPEPGPQPVISNASGRIPLGGIYGVELPLDWPTAPPDVQMAGRRMQAVMELFAGLRTPSHGVVLVPPQVTVIASLRNPDMIERATVLENLTFSLRSKPRALFEQPRSEELTVDAQQPGKHEPKHGSQGLDQRAAALAALSALCLALGMNSDLFSTHALERGLPLQQALFQLTAFEREMICFVKAILPMPDVLLIEDLGPLSKEQASRVHRVLERFVAGVDLAGLTDQSYSPPDAVLETPVPPAAAEDALGPGRRTVVWMTPSEVLDTCGIQQRVCVTEDCQISLVDQCVPMGRQTT